VHHRIPGLLHGSRIGLRDGVASIAATIQVHEDLEQQSQQVVELLSQ
jgi:hypothetical protein